jgi:hypothetical protein
MKKKNKERITKLDFSPQIKVDCYGVYSVSEIEESLREDRCFFPSNWRMTNEIIGKINLYPQIKDNYFDMDDRYDFPLNEIVDCVIDDIMVLGKTLGVYFPKYKPNGDEYRDDEHKKMEKLYYLRIRNEYVG